MTLNRRNAGFDLINMCLMAQDEAKKYINPDSYCWIINYKPKFCYNTVYFGHTAFSKTQSCELEVATILIVCIVKTV